MYSRYQVRQLYEVWIGLKRLLRYLKESMDMELKYERNIEDLPLVHYDDSDWVSDVTENQYLGVCCCQPQKLRLQLYAHVYKNHYGFETCQLTWKWIFITSKYMKISRMCFNN